jgi:hypothetical protein
VDFGLRAYCPLGIHTGLIIGFGILYCCACSVRRDPCRESEYGGHFRSFFKKRENWSENSKCGGEQEKEQSVLVCGGRTEKNKMEVQGVPRALCTSDSLSGAEKRGMEGGTWRRRVTGHGHRRRRKLLANSRPATHGIAVMFRFRSGSDLLVCYCTRSSFPFVGQMLVFQWWPESNGWPKKRSKCWPYSGHS